MKNHYYILSSILISLFTIILAPQSVYSQDKVFPDDAWGVYSWTQFTSIDKNSAPLVKGGPIITRWANLEPQDGVYAFDSEIDAKLQRAQDNNWYVFIKIYLAGPAESGFTPEWLYDNGIPKVATSRGNFPYYFYLYQKGQPPAEGSYQYYYFRLINALASYLLEDLDPNLRDRVLFVQCTEGSTGDGYCYKGTPPYQYDISREEWSDFRLDAWKEFKAAFSKDDVLQIPLLTNDDANNDALRQWMLDELQLAIGVKNGMFTHGYQISDAQDRLAEHFKLKEDAEAAGKVFFARGEMDAELNREGWITKNQPQGLYWSAIYATHCGITMWNIIQDAVKLSKYNDAINFFNKYSGELNPETANGAFCAFYRGLDASDVITFPTSTYGYAEKQNTQRYIKICDAFSQYGARMGDVSAATGGGMVNRGATDYNDAGWQILKGNLRRHITQIDPEETSVAWWQIDESIYGRFARGFEHSSNKNTMYFNLDDNFFGSSAGVVTMNVIYYDKNPGSTWELQYDAGAGSFKTAFAVTCAGTGNWIKRRIVLTDAEMLNNGPQSSDFALVNTDTLDDIFHIIELERGGTPQDAPGQSSNPIPPDDAEDVAVNMVLSWSAGTGVTEQGIYIGTDSLLGPDNFVGIQSVNKFDPDSLQLNTTYYWRVDGYNDGGSSTGPVWKFTTESTPISAPDNLICTTISKNQIDLSWADNSDNETGFSIERSTDGITSWEEIASVSENVIMFSDSLLNPSTIYYYRVRASKLYGYSNYSNITNATTMDDPVPPIAPDSLVALGILGDQINLKWIDNSLNEDLFYIERSDDGTTEWIVIDSVIENITKYSDTGLNAETTYYYRVQAKNKYGLSSYSNTANATTLLEGGIITYLSDLVFTEIENGWGPVELDRSNATQDAGDGNVITINGITYEKGLGCHAYSELSWNLAGQALTFLSDIGVDDEMEERGSIVFEVHLDDQVVYMSDVLTGLDDAVKIVLDITDVNILKLVINDAGDGKGSDHGDWADARVISRGVIVGTPKNEDIVQPKKFSLYQNYPNPFNPTTKINYYLPKDARVQLDVYDIRGGKIKTLVVGEQSSNNFYTVQWDGKNESGNQVSAGVYFYRIRAVGKKNVWIKTRKMILLK